MPDMNAALHAQERNDVSSRWYRQQSMADRKYGSTCGADYACCNICDAKCKASGGNTSNLRKPQIFLKAEEIFHRPQIYSYNSCIRHRQHASIRQRLVVCSQQRGRRNV
ncbi:hypothetical protein CHARACLAT_032546 [Characodon lateralis]|uniref:Uncharacterized protein n=1 Tax=Characodon lateralis TaxID=208331 RepID=A0ABU7EYX2_9TELE|nr:hypothetical protein [Characodon lateralis]